MTDIEATLAARQSRYGTFADNARVAQTLKQIMRDAPLYCNLEDDQIEALEMIASKIGRMLTGDVNYIDSWHDIAGYATLIERRLNGESL